MIIHYKCPNCGNDMKYDADSSRLYCEFCGREDLVEDFPEENINREFSDEVLEYHCDNCGANLITEEETIATNCSFCGAAMVIGDRISGDMAPSKLIPFSISKDRAQKAFKKWAGKGRLTPRGFVTADRIKNISGMYIPFWLYDLKTDGAVKGTGTKVRTYRSGDYIYTETSYYEVYRKIDLRYLKVPVDASKKMADGLMDLLEPYNYSDLKEFKPAYLAGFIAEKYDYDEQEMLPRAKAKIEDYVDSFIRSTSYQYASISFGYKDIDTKNENAYYSLLPIWMVYYDYKGKDYVFAMNGQTGKVVGKPPISKRKVLLWFLSVFMLVFLGSSLLALVLGGGF